MGFKLSASQVHQPRTVTTEPPLPHHCMHIPQDYPKAWSDALINGTLDDISYDYTSRFKTKFSILAQTKKSWQ